MSKDMDFWHLRGIYPTNMEKKLLDTAAKTGVGAAKTAFIKLVHKTAKV